MNSTGRLRLAAAAIVGASLVAGCAGNAPAEFTGKVPYKKPGEQPSVAAPTRQDTVLGPDATPVPLSTAKKPNLLMITMDDAALKDMQFMPHLQKLVADQGVTIANGIAPSPICVPARASLLSGQYAQNHHALTISGEGGGYQSFPDANTLPVSLQQAGYDTMMVGKYLNGYGRKDIGHQPPGWSIWRPLVDPATYNYEHPLILIDGKLVRSDTYSTTLLSDQSNTFIKDEAAKTGAAAKPWYMWVTYVAPHTGGPRQPDDPVGIGTPDPEKRDRGTFKSLKLDTTPEMFEKDPSDKRIIKAARRISSPARKAGLRIDREQRVESLQSVDRAIARTIATLKSTGQLKNTYVVVTSDNGYFVGEHNLNGKLWYFRDSVKIPMFIRGPGVPKGITSQAPVTNADWAPTFAALAGTKMHRVEDGVNVMPWLASKADRRVIPIAGWPVHGGLTPLYTGVMVGPWTYVRGKRGGGEMYYDKSDPYQLYNIYSDPRFKSQRKELRRLWLQTRDCAGPTCPKTFMR